jgi:hypothetical protein
MIVATNTLFSGIRILAKSLAPQSFLSFFLRRAADLGQAFCLSNENGKDWMIERVSLDKGMHRIDG